MTRCHGSPEKRNVRQWPVKMRRLFTFNHPANAVSRTHHRNRARRRSSDGFTLLEVLVAATVLWIGIAGSLSGFQTVNSVYRDQRHMTQALQIAEGVAEELLCFSATDAYLEAGTHPVQPWQYDANAQRVTANGRYRVQWLVTPNIPVTGIRKIDIRVAWDDNTERDFSLSIHR